MMLDCPHHRQAWVNNTATIRQFLLGIGGFAELSFGDTYPTLAVVLSVWNFRFITDTVSNIRNHIGGNIGIRIAFGIGFG